VNIYPTLVPSATYGRIQGMVWKVESAEHFSRPENMRPGCTKLVNVRFELKDREILRDYMPFFVGLGIRRVGS